MRGAFYAGQKKIQVNSCVPDTTPNDHVKIAVSYCGICGTDLHIFHGHMDQRIKVPQVIGHEMSGTIIDVGNQVQNWNPGDRVTVRPLDPCNTCPACNAGHSHICQNLKFLGIDTPGAMQSVWTVPAHTLHRLPLDLSLRTGALIEPMAVACHDVRLAEILPDEFALVQGGGPIGLLVALVAKMQGARVVISELNPYRLALANQMGLSTVNPNELDLIEFVNQETSGAGADIVFEVSGSKAGASVMTQLLRTRGRIVVVAIHSQPTEIDLFRFFWRELKLIGVRVYEPEDFEEAIKLVTSEKVLLNQLITKVLPLEESETGFHELTQGGQTMKILLQCSTND